MLATARRCAVLATAIGLIGAPAAAQPPPAAAQPPPPTVTSTPFATPDTDRCPHRVAPPPAIDLSEVPAPGDPTPTPLPVPQRPIGGGDLDRCGIVTADGTPPLPAEISATGWVLADLDSGAVLAAKDPHGRYRPASTIKILLAIVALNELDLDTVVTATEEDANIEGSAVGLGKGGTYTIRQLMQGLVMASGNDAAHALASQLGGVDETVRKMNETAQGLGAFDTRAATPSGLDGPGMSTSAYDLALLYREAMRNPTFAELIRTESVEFPGFPRDPNDPLPTTDPAAAGDPASSTPVPTDHPPFTLANDNSLLYNYPGALGGKTGYTDDARQTFVAGAERDGRRLVVTLLAADVRPIRPWEQAARLLDHGFALPASTSVGTLVDPGSADAAPAPSILLATPPPPAADDHDEPGAAPSRVPVLVGGGVVIAALLIGAALLQRRRR
ncbi:D-alanyl-D-alanine carboxypeptidase family protein [Rhodococcus sp. NPDC054953]